MTALCRCNIFDLLDTREGSVKQKTGICPNCDSEGPIGDTCPEKGCHKRRYAFIPPEFHDKLKTIPTGSADVLIGLTIDDYMIVGATEVTVKMHVPCVRSGQCTEPLTGPCCNLGA